MREMEDSRIEWAKKIPKDFNIVRMQDIGNYKKGPFGSSITINMFVDKSEDTIKVYEQKNAIYEDAKLGYYYITSSDFQKLKDFEVFPGDIIVSCAGTIGKCYIMPKTMERGIINQALMKITLFPTVNKDYFMFLFGVALDEMAKVYSNGSAIKNIPPFSVLKKYKLPVPTLSEQKILANFLNCQSVEIDSLTADIQAQIETLEQYKRSVITETVTKGLNPDADKKDSGIEYVGSIPAHWDMRPVYYYFVERKNKNALGKEDNLLSLSYGRIIRKDINTSEGLLPESFNTYNIIEAGDIVIRPTDLQNDKRSLRTGLAKEHGIITSAYLALKPKDELVSAYYHYLLNSFDVMKVFYNMGNGVRQGLNFSEFSRLMVFAPPIDEQKAIADFLDEKCVEINEAIATKKTQLETLNEYKKSVIYEYVTGKKEVAV